LKNVHHDGSVFLVGNAAADALLEYGAALIGEREVRVVELPIVNEYGFIARARISLGPSTHIVVTHAEDDELEPADIRFVAALDGQRRHSVGPVAAVPTRTTVGRAATCPIALLGVRCDGDEAHQGQHRAVDDIGATWAWIGHDGRL
jgi:hypothetical protein